MAVYLDCNSTTPLEPSVASLVSRFMERDYGNAASPIHDFGIFARMAVEHARGQLAELVAARREEVIFTSGATEANNIALLGLAEYGLASGRRHVIGSVIEHKAVLEPLEELQRLGFAVELLPAGADGRVAPEALAAALRPDTLLVSLMQVNNETGVAQPLADYAALLAGHPAYWHVDAAQGFGKQIAPLQNPRIDLISASGHKIYGPKGVGVLIARRRENNPPPLRSLMYGGGQEQGLRPGTLPVPLIAGLGEAAKLALRDNEQRIKTCLAFRREALDALAELSPLYNGDQQQTLPHCLNLSLPGIAADRAIAALKPLVAVSSTSACTSHTRTPSHVLAAMGFSGARVECAFRMSWCHLTPPVDWPAVVATLKRLQQGG